MHHLEADKAAKEKATQELHENARSHIEQILEVISYKATTVWLPTSHL